METRFHHVTFHWIWLGNGDPYNGLLYYLYNWVVQSPIWVFPKIGVSQNGWFIMENPIKMGWFGATPIFGNTHITQPTEVLITVHISFPLLQTTPPYASLRRRPTWWPCLPTKSHRCPSKNGHIKTCHRYLNKLKCVKFFSSKREYRLSSYINRNFQKFNCYLHLRSLPNKYIFNLIKKICLHHFRERNQNCYKTFEMTSMLGGSFHHHPPVSPIFPTNSSPRPRGISPSSHVNREPPKLTWQWWKRTNLRMYFLLKIGDCPFSC